MARGTGTRGYAVWPCAVAVMLTTACGGQAFVFEVGDASSSTVPADAALVDAPPANLNLLCGSAGCASSGTCCTSPSETPHCTMAGGLCSPCDTELKCTTDDNCGSATPRCCVGPAASLASAGCSANKYFLSQCKVGCGVTETRLCNPVLAAPCAAKETCSEAASDLQAWGLPPGEGYGVCIGM